MLTPSIWEVSIYLYQSSKLTINFVHQFESMTCAILLTSIT